MSSPRVAAVTKFIDSFNAMDMEVIRPLIGPGFIYTFGPSSATLPPPMDFDSWANQMTSVRPLLKAYPVTIKTLIDCGDAENKVVVHATGQAQFKDEVMDDSMPKEEWVNN